jgi:hypothetical protein
VRITCETCDQAGTGSWRVLSGRPTVCCDGCNPSAAPGAELPLGFSYVRWFPLPGDITPDLLLEYVTPEVLAREYGRQ